VNAIAPKGWCPSLFEPMLSGDGWLTRVKPPHGALSSAASRILAAAAAQFGNGIIELTNRANLQVRGLSPDGIAPFAKAIVAGGLADPDPATERRRAVIHPPLKAVSAHAADEIEGMLAGDAQLARLPPKFAVAVDGGGLLPLGETVADLTVVCTETCALILPAGSNSGANLGARDVVEGVRRVALAFLALAERQQPPSRRMRTLMGVIGGATLFAAAGLDASMPIAPRATQRAIGWLPHPDSDHGVFGLGVPFGMMTAATLASLADLAEQYGDAGIRLTPWRAVVLPNVAGRDRHALQAASTCLGLIVDPTDPRRTIVTCSGKPGCAAASVDVRTDAALLQNLHLPALVHVSGCAKGCAHHAAAPITLVGEGGRYGIIRDGNASGVPSRSGLTMQQIVAVLGGEG
jgi:precorrin-3B synthase